ncbi:hypothetical protein V6N13_029674 [Hibiscus sabdariffa]
MHLRRGGGINNNPSSKGKEFEEHNFSDDAFDDSDDDDSVDENAFDDFAIELLTDDLNSNLSKKSHEPI